MKKEDKKLLGMCVCVNCPSWVSCGEKGGFCLQTVGKSGCIKKEKGCICGGCPVTGKLDLLHVYYCTRGSEEEQK